jgi:hypothetical protein
VSLGAAATDGGKTWKLDSRTAFGSSKYFHPKGAGMFEDFVDTVEKTTIA